MGKRLTPIERFISEIPTDPRRAYDRRQAEKGLTRVTVTVPTERAEILKVFARLLRNTSDEQFERLKTDFADYWADVYRDFDEAVAEGRA